MMADVLSFIRVTRLSDEEGGGYFAEVPHMPGCASDGRTIEEAMGNVAEAMASWRAAARKMGRGDYRLPLRTAERPMEAGQ